MCQEFYINIFVLADVMWISTHLHKFSTLSSALGHSEKLDYLPSLLGEMVEINNCHHCMTGIFLDAGKVAKCRAYLYGFINSFSPWTECTYLATWQFGANHYARTRTPSNVTPLTRLTLGMRLLARTWRAGGEWQIWAYVNNIAGYTAINPGMGH